MQISNQQIGKFIEMYQNRFGIVLDRNIAHTKALQLIEIVKATYKPVTKKDYEKYSKEV